MTDGRIAYVDLDGQLHTMGAAGEAPVAVTRAGGRFVFTQFPAWSPDGRWLAAIAGDRVRAGVYVFADRAGAEPDELYSSRAEAPIYLYWAPDSRRVGYLHNSRRRGLGLRIARLGQSGSQVLAEGRPCFWDWLKDGRHALVHLNLGAEDDRLDLVELEEGAGARFGPRPGLFQVPGLSYRGEYASVSTLDADGVTHVSVIRRDSGERLLAYPHPGMVAMTWSPAGAHLAFIAPDQREADEVGMSWTGPLRVFDVETRGLRTLVDEPVLAFFWSPDGRTIAYLTLDLPARSGLNGYVNGRNGHGPRAMEPVRPVRLAVGLVDRLTRERRRLAQVVPLDLFVAQFLPFFDQYALSHRLWSPDSAALVLPVEVDGTPTVVRLDAADGRLTPLAPGTMAAWSAT